MTNKCVNKSETLTSVRQKWKWWSNYEKVSKTGPNVIWSFVSFVKCEPSLGISNAKKRFASEVQKIIFVTGIIIFVIW